MKNRRLLGDVYQFKLPNNKYAFGRIFKDACIAIYNEISDDPSNLPEEEAYLFIVGIYDYVLESDDWVVVANRPFENDEDAWPPPMYIKDQLTGEYRIYHKGKMRGATKEQCEGLEEAAVWNDEHIIERIMESFKNNRTIGDDQY